MKDRSVILQMVEDMTENPLCPESCGCREYYAEALFDTGYRKQSETAEKFAERIKEKFPIYDDLFTFIIPEKLHKAVDEILKEITEQKDD